MVELLDKKNTWNHLVSSEHSTLHQQNTISYICFIIYYFLAMLLCCKILTTGKF